MSLIGKMTVVGVLLCASAMDQFTQAASLSDAEPGDETSSSLSNINQNSQGSSITGVDDPVPSCGINLTGNTCEANPDVGSAPGGNLPGNSVGNPINLMSGNKHQSDVDFQLPGAMLSLRRMYNSGSSDTNLGLGQGWHHSYSVSLFDGGNGTRQIVQSNGAHLVFTEQGADGQGHPLYVAAQANQGYLTYENERHIWHLPDGRTLSFQGSFLIEIDWPDQRKLKLYYRARRLHSVSDETGRVLLFSYTGGSRANLLPAYDKLRFDSAPGYLESVTLPDGQVIAFDYDQKRNLTRVRYPNGTDREYHYENESYPNHLTGLTDQAGVRFASWRYDDEGRAILSEHADGVERVTLEYPDSLAVATGDVVHTQVTNSLGYQSSYSWQQASVDAQPRLLTSEGAGCATCPQTGVEYTYDEQGRLLKSTNTGQGNATGRGSLTYAYDGQGRIAEVRRIDAAGVDHLVERREYAANSLMPVRTFRPSVNLEGERVTETTFDINHRPVRIVERGYAPVFSITSAGGAVAESENDLPVGMTYMPIERQSDLIWEGDRLVAIDGPRSDVEDVTHLQWDEKNRLIGIRSPASPALRMTEFDALGRITRYQLGTRSPIELSYNYQGKVIQSRQGEKILWLDYDEKQRLSKLRDNDGHVMTLSFDAAGRMTSVTDELGRTKTLSHDTESRLVRRTAIGIDGTMIRAMEYLFDERGDLTRRREERAGGSAPSVQVLDYERNTSGGALQVSDTSTGARVSTVIDQVSRIATLTGVDGSVTQVQFDTQGATTRVIDARGNVTASFVDDFGRTVMKSNADTGRVISQFDEAGNVTQMTFADGPGVTFSYDAANRRTSRKDSARVTAWLWNATSGLLTEAANGTTTERFDYDNEGRLTHHERRIDGHRFQTHYAYDSRGRRREKALPDGQQLNYHYYEEGLHRGSLRAITRSSWHTLFRNNTLIAEIDVERGDGVAGYVSGNGVRTSEYRAPNGELTRLEVGGTLAFGYEFDAAGRIVRIDHDDTDGRSSNTYEYEYGRLTRAYSSTLGTQTWHYDALGNRTVQETRMPSGDTQVSHYEYPEDGQGNRLLAVHGTQGRSDADMTASTEYIYNRAGAPRQIGKLSYTYDDWQRALSVSRDGQLLAEYAYNAFGERVKKTRYQSGKTPQVTYYLYDGRTVTAEADAKGGITQQYVYLEGHRPVALLRGQDSYAIHADHRGAARQVTDESGQVVWQADYRAFGDAVIDTNSTLSLNLRLPGQYSDAETGTYYNYFRDYDPDIGRYQTSDPMGLLAGLNTYAYVGGNPLNLIDPDGRIAVPVVAGGAFWTWITTASTVSGPPGWLVGGVVGLGVAAYWYANHNDEGEQGFLDQTGNAKPSVDDFNSLRFELEQYDPAAASQIDLSDWDGNWSGLFTLQDTLLNSQQAYVGRMDACIASGMPMLPIEQQLYDQATASILLAEQAGDANGGENSSDDSAESSSDQEAIVPDRANEVLEHVKEFGSAPAGYKGGREFANDGRQGGEVLPEVDGDGNPITYKEFDINPFVKGVNRGPERIVVGSDGKAYYTDDHYDSFTQMG